ncbi:hypothetical protein [Gimesia aquarii]|uniref:Uncharacterized protein n=1 Tax=Gimesia aquarii TaxID=2527964 RepID=A0A517WRK6_9PLAN|nr:hypothetical protein [Gimesia aquarii]QDU07890.1 hypothetical protein V202x_12510 [Gimesia aquarii]
MAWPEISLEDFPPKRDDEPSSLRQDILDELTDHFSCALNRELLKNSDERLAQERVIKQFGDPVKIAHQLWFDAMKEKIMSQRIMTGVSVVMAVCCIAVVGIAWSLMKESQAINQNLAAQLAAIVDRPQPVVVANMDQQILKQLDELKRGQATQIDSSSEEMNQILFQLVQEKRDGKPAAGFSGTLAKIEDNNEIFKVNATSDAMGQLDFGKLPWGTYHLKLHSPWNEDLYRFNNISAIPGRKYEETIVCPAGVPEEVPVQFEVNWPTQPENEDYYLLCDFRRMEPSQSSPSVNQFYLNSERSFQQHYWWTYRRDLSKQPVKGVYLIDVKNNQVTPCPLEVDGKFEDLDLQKLVWQQNIEIFQGDYFAPNIYLLRKSELMKLNELNSVNQIPTIEISESGIYWTYYNKPYYGLFISPFEEMKIEPQLLKTLKYRRSNFTSPSNKYSTTLKQIHGFRENRFSSKYIAKKDQANLWEIKIPDFKLIFQEFGSSNSVL